jgi:hypothetical protein
LSYLLGILGRDRSSAATWRYNLSMPLIHSPASSALAGARSWAGHEHELAAAVLLAAHVLAEEPVRWLRLPDDDAVPEDVKLQVDAPVDDIVVALRGGGTAWVQARRTLTGRAGGPTALSGVVKQWAAQDAAAALDPVRDRVVGVSAELKGVAADAAKELDRLRRHQPGRATAGQRKARQAVEAHVGPPADAGRILACGVLHEIDAAAEHARDRVDAERLLERHVVVDSQGRLAWLALESALGHTAPERGGLDRRRLLEAVAAVCDLRIPRPGSRMAADLAEREHRCRTMRHARRLAFAGLRQGAAPVERDRADAGVRATTVASDTARDGGDEEPRLGSEPAVLARHHGRLLLCGLPGAGKSTALADIAADMAGDPAGPVPLTVGARTLLAALRDAPARSALLSCAFAAAPAGERTLLKQVADEAIQNGRAAVLVDALDECDDPQAVLRGICQVLEDGDPGVEAVIATRDVHLAESLSTTRWAAAELLPPLWPQNLAREVLVTAAQARGMEDPQSWVDLRLGWTLERFDQIEALNRTPLLVVLVAQVCAVRDQAALPTTPAEVLCDVVQVLIEDWEAAKPDDRVDVGLPGTHAIAALHLAFRTIGTAVLDGNDAADAIRSALAGRLAVELDAKPAVARAAAEAALRFWDRCGVFVVDAATQCVVPRARQLAELAAALDMLDVAPEDLSARVSTIALEPTSSEVMRFAAGLSDAARTAAMTGAAASGDVGAILRAARLPASDHDDAAAGLADAAAAAALRENDPAAALELAIAAADLAATPSVAALIDDWPLAGQRILLAARMALRASADEIAPFVALLELDDIERSGEDELWAALGPHLHFSATVVDVAPRMLSADPSWGPRLVERLERLSIVDAGRLQDVLTAHGHGELVRQAVERDTAKATAEVDFEHSTAGMHAAERQILEWIAEAAPPGALNVRQRRGLRELAALWSALRIAHAPAFEPAGLLQRHPHLARAVIELALHLLGQDPALLAAQAATVLEQWTGVEPPLAKDVLYLHDGEVPSLADWDAIENKRAAEQLLIDALALGRWLPSLATAMLLTAPVSPERAEQLQARIPDLPRAQQRTQLAMVASWWRRSIAALDELLADADPAVRRGAARMLVFLASRGDESRRVAALADDPDDGVRAAMLEAMAGQAPTPESRAPLEAADWSPRPWLCLRCEYDNTPGDEACKHCHIVGADTARQLKRVLGPAAAAA